jgi:uncharacterized membrane protein
MKRERGVESEAGLVDAMPIQEVTIEKWFLRGHITAAQRAIALEQLYGPKHWLLWIGRLLLSLGVACLLSGIVFFFAFNWQALFRFTKLGVIEAGMVLSLLGAYVLRRNPLAVGMFSLCASVLVGVFLAVFGQIYQTGANAYSLFLGWAVLSAPWVLLARFLPLWAAWVVLVNVTLVLYVDQTLHIGTMNIIYPMCGMLMALNACLLAAREGWLVRGCAWLAPTWPRRLLGVMILTPGFILLSYLVLDLGRFRIALPWALLVTMIHGGMWWVYRYLLPDIRVLSMVLFSFSSLLALVIIRVINNVIVFDGAVFLLAGGLTYGIFAAAVAKLSAVAKQMEVGHES